MGRALRSSAPSKIDGKPRSASMRLITLPGVCRVGAEIGWPFCFFASSLDIDDVFGLARTTRAGATLSSERMVSRMTA
jgi:hypothetical protein